MAIGSVTKFYAGDTSDIWEVGFILSEPDNLATLDEDFSCRIAVLEAPDFAARAVPDKNAENTRFRAWLTPEETFALGPGVWTVGIEISNPAMSPPLVKEVHRRIRIEPQVVTD